MDILDDINNTMHFALNTHDNTTQCINTFIERTKYHKELVYGFGVILGKNYSTHDNEKLTDLLKDYALISKEDRTKEEQDRLDKVTIHHITSNMHHPEYWSRDKRLKNFSRQNPINQIDATKMTNSAIEEMCCDWCAMSKEFNNTPFEWADKNIGTRWIFSEEQKMFIYTTLRKLWNDDAIPFCQ